VDLLGLGLEGSLSARRTILSRKESDRVVHHRTTCRNTPRAKPAGCLVIVTVFAFKLA